MSLSNPLGKMRVTRPRDGLISRQARISQQFYHGSLVGARAGSEHVENPPAAAPRADLVVLGTIEAQPSFLSSSTDDGTGGAMDATVSPNQPQMMQIRTGVLGWFQTGTSTHQILGSHIDQPCFRYDDDTVYIDDLNGTLPFAGYVDSVQSDGTIAIRIGDVERSQYALWSAGQGAGAARTDDLTARTVATSIPAGTITAGVYTASANAAFSTAQDGVTMAVGDIFILPEGTITTLVVTAAQSGPYEVVSLGSASTPWSFKRPARWAHGDLITPGGKVRVGGEPTLFKNTTWTAGPATAAKLVGTDSPDLYPDKVIQTVVLVASEKAIANVPIRSATQSNVHAALAAVGGTTTSTIGYGIIVAPTPGGIGTATTTVNAIASGGTKNGTADTSSLIVTILN